MLDPKERLRRIFKSIMSHKENYDDRVDEAREALCDVNYSVSCTDLDLHNYYYNKGAKDASRIYLNVLLNCWDGANEEWFLEIVDNKENKGSLI